jgi:hypothetical protein
MVMVSLGKRRDTSPIIRNSDGSYTRPVRIPFTAAKFEEKWLQDLIEATPHLLPIMEIEPAFSPPISIGKEVELASGYIDNLLISPQGYVTIVETKLWRNPEARREAVSQIIDYAAALSRWTFEKLEEKVKDYNKHYRKSSLGIIDTLKLIEDFDQNDEQPVIDTISRNLQLGRFLLLIVGDGIRESLENMIDFIQQSPRLHFTLALVELQVYQLDKDESRSLLVIPQIVARTKEITRAIIRVEGKAIDSIKVDVGTELETLPSKSAVKYARYTITEEAFFNELGKNVNYEDVSFINQLKEDLEKMGCITEWQQASFVSKLPDPGESGVRLSLLGVDKNGHPFLCSALRGQTRSIGLGEDVADDYANEISSLLNLGKKVWDNYLPLAEVRQNYDKFKYIIEKTIKRIKAQ